MIANNTRVFAIGVTDYHDNSLHLRYAARNVTDFAAALSSDVGCAIPRHNVTVLIDGDATRKGILDTLTVIARSCSPEDVLIIFFSGHGEKDDENRFFLLPVDTDKTNLCDSAISMAELVAVLTQCAAAGILLILDCCRSAGFAENAGPFFMNLGEHGFRLLLAASRAGQLSYEYHTQKGTIFSKRLNEIVGGDVAIGQRPGVVYFQDLYDYLLKKVAEDLETIGQPRTSQQPVFAGTYVGDPRLFIHRQITLARLEDETPQYSRHFVRRRLRRALTRIVVLMLSTLCIYYYYLEHSYYVWPSASTVDGFAGDYLTIYAGDSRLNALGFPHFVRATDLLSAALPEDARPGLGEPPATHISPDIDGKVQSKLETEWLAITSAWTGDANAAAQYANEIEGDSDADRIGLAKAVSVVPYVVGYEHCHRLIEKNILAFSFDRVEAAMRAIARWDPNRAVATLNGQDSDYDIQQYANVPSVQNAFLQGLASNCISPVNTEIERLAAEIFTGNEWGALMDSRREAWYAALLRTGCMIRPDIVTRVFENDAYESTTLDADAIALSSQYAGQPMAAKLVDDIKRLTAALKTQTANDQYDSSLRIWLDLRMLALVDVRSVPNSTWGLLHSKHANIRLAAGIALLAKEPNQWRLILDAGRSDPWIVTALAENGKYDDAAARAAIVSLAPASGETAADRTRIRITELFLRWIRRRHIVEAIPVVREIETKFKEPWLRVEATWTLDTLGAKIGERTQISARNQEASPARLVRLDPVPQVTRDFHREAFRWAISVNYLILSEYMSQFGVGENTVSDVAEFLGRSTLSEVALADLRQRLGVPSQRLAACAVLAMRGNEADLAALLSAPELQVRETAESYAVYNPRITKVIQNPALRGFGLQTTFYLERQRDMQLEIVKILTRLPPEIIALAPSILISGIVDVSPGLKLWVEDVKDSAPASAFQGLDEAYIESR